MKLAPLQLIRYWVDDLEIHSNRAFKPDEPPDLAADSLSIESDVQEVRASSKTPEEKRWIVTLSIKQDQVEGRNAPYWFRLNMAGIVAAHPRFPTGKLQQAVEVNGPSMLFGVAREIIRDSTGRGPFPPVLIPSTTFIPNPKSEGIEEHKSGKDKVSPAKRRVSKAKPK